MKNDNYEPSTQTSVIEHLEELRKRLVFVLAGWLILSLAAYFFSEEILGFVICPLSRYQEKPVFTRPAEPFIAVIKLSAFAGAFLNIPNLLGQAWLFLSPALTKKEKKAAVFVFCGFPVLFFAGALFSLYVIVPFGLRVMFSFAGEAMDPFISIGGYLNFVLVFIAAFGMIFNLPVIMGGLASAGIVSSELLRTKRRYAILASFVLAAIATPPDVITQILVAIPLVFLYEISIIFAKLFKR